MPRTITAKQRAFAEARVEGNNALSSYKIAGYGVGACSDRTIVRMAQKLELNPLVVEEMSRLREIHAERHEITIDSLLAELDEARKLAIERRDPGAMVRSTMGKAKITGHDKKVLEIRRAEIGLNIVRAC